MRSRIRVALGLLLALSLAWSAPAAGEDGDHDKDHQGPHGGVLVEVGDEADTHAEIVRDREKGKLTLYLLSKDRRTPVAIPDAPRINLKTQEGKKQVEMKAVEPVEGKANQWEAEHEALQAEKLDGRIAVVLADGKSYQVPFEPDHKGHGH